MRRLLLASALLLAAWAVSSAAAPRAHGCAATITPTTYEAMRDRTAYLFGEELAGFNMIAPQDGFFGIPTVEEGPRADRGVTSDPYVPPVLLKSVGYIESALAQAANSVPWGATGPTLISFDCGHGIMQITSGMTNPDDGGWPSGRQSIIATHYVYNIARGSAILVDKWNYAPEARPVVGLGNPTVVEDWYYALWGYNGFASTNNPITCCVDNTWPRTGYSCGPADDGYGHDRGDYPYQELVYGCASRPPRVDGQALWTAPDVPYALPDVSNPTWRDPISNFPNSDLMDIGTPLPWHYDQTPEPAAGSAAYVLGSPSLSVSRSDVPVGSTEVTISNTGSGILAWRAKPAQPWLHLNKQAGVALGPGVPCSAGAPCDRSPTIKITVDPGASSGWVDVVSLTTWESRRISVVGGPVFDANCDGLTSSVDAALVLQFDAGLVNWLPCPVTADANGDGWVDSLDAALILQRVAGLI
ncbi:MAG: dockerin type I repeat-containing protein [Dehalococcoidia bacterium]|nr:dockerin type I repeat-containing protein [Dehalococcoidia bacterium]